MRNSECGIKKTESLNTESLNTESLKTESLKTENTQSGKKMNNISSSLPPISMNLDTANLSAANLSAANLTEIDSLKKASDAEIKKVGEDFESIFLSLMLKEMRNTISNEEGGGMFAGEGSDTYGGLFDMFMSQHLASSSQLGIGKAIESYLGNKT